MKVKVCRRGYEYVSVNGKNGEVELCCWISTPNDRLLGSLLDHTMEELYQGERAKIFRESMYDGSYQICMKKKDMCPWLSNGTLDEHLIEVDTEDEAVLPRQIALGYERTCNYNCTMCYAHDPAGKKTYEDQERVRKIEEQLKPIVNHAAWINANGWGELFASQSIMKLLGEWKPDFPAEKVEVVLESNGSLFDEEHWKKIQNLGQYRLSVHITVLSFEENTYRFLSGTSLPVSRVIDNLRFIKSLRESGEINYLELATVVQESNFRTLPEFTRRCIEEFGADTVRIRSFFPWGARSREFEWFEDIRNPLHPLNKEYLEVMKDPIFSHPKVFKWSGDEVSGIGSYTDYVLPGQVLCAAKDIGCAQEGIEAIKKVTGNYELYLADVLKSLAETEAGPEEILRMMETELSIPIDSVFRQRLTDVLRQMTDMHYVNDSIRIMREKYSHMVIMGTGQYGKRMALQFQNCGVEFDGFVVSDGRCHAEEVMDKPVWCLSELPFPKEDVGLIGAMHRYFWNEVQENVQLKGFHYLYPFAVLSDLEG